MTNVVRRDERRIPVIVGVGQYTNRSPDLSDAREPLEMMALVARRAEQDTGVKGILARVDSVQVVNILSWHYPDPAGFLAQTIDAHPQEKLYTTIGGNTPQWLVNETAGRIVSGKVRLALLAGAEAMASMWRARKQGIRLNWTRGEGIPELVGDSRIGTNEVEMHHGAQIPVHIYPLFENALRADRRRGVVAHQELLGEMCAGFARVAKNHPYAWFRDGKAKEKIVTITPDNRMVGFPYPKYMNAIMDVDQAAAIILTNVATAKELHIPPSKWVYVWGCGDATDLWYITDRVNYYSAPALQIIAKKTLAMTGLSIQDIDYFDLYSCFPSAVQIARDMLEIPENDPRSLTVTGGLPYFGGPGNNYTMHAIATVVEKLRGKPQKKALVTAVGWYMTKHAMGIYSGEPPRQEWQREDPQLYQKDIDALPHPLCLQEANGSGTIETYTVLHNRDGEPEKAIVIGRLADNRRFIANTEPDRDLFRQMMAEEMIGKRGRVSPDLPSGLNIFRPQE